MPVLIKAADLGENAQINILQRIMNYTQGCNYNSIAKLTGLITGLQPWKNIFVSRHCGYCLSNKT